MPLLNESEKKLIEENMRLVYFVIAKMKITRENRNYDDYVSAGFLGLCSAAFNYRKNRAAFSTYACKIIENQVYSAMKLYSEKLPSKENIDELAFTEENYEKVEDNIFAEELLKESQKFLSDDENAILSFLLSGKTIKETSEKFSVTPAAVIKVKRVTVSKLRKQLSKEGIS